MPSPLHASDTLTQQPQRHVCVCVCVGGGDRGGGEGNGQGFEECHSVIDLLSVLRNNSGLEHTALSFIMHNTGAFSTCLEAGLTDLPSTPLAGLDITEGVIAGNGAGYVVNLEGNSTDAPLLPSHCADVLLKAGTSECNTHAPMYGVWT